MKQGEQLTDTTVGAGFPDRWPLGNTASTRICGPRGRSTASKVSQKARKSAGEWQTFRLDQRKTRPESFLERWYAIAVKRAEGCEPHMTMNFLYYVNTGKTEGPSRHSFQSNSLTRMAGAWRPFASTNDQGV
jgi:hypothetical protein